MQAVSPAEARSARPTLQQQLKQAEVERLRLRTQAGYAIRDRTVALQRHCNFWDRLQRQTPSIRARANNKLAGGAMFEQSVATEAAAAATRCDTRSRELQAEVDDARRQCAARGRS